METKLTGDYQMLDMSNAMLNTAAEGVWRVEKEVPWLPPEAIKFLDKYIQNTHRVLDIGSGGSTVFFARRALHVLALESGGYSHRKDKLPRSLQWFEIVSQALEKNRLTNADLYLLQGYPSSNRAYRDVISAIPDESLHWVLVDGANRRTCIDICRDKIVPGYYMIIDNYEEHLKDAEDFLSWESFVLDEPTIKRWPGGGTIFYKKPSKA